jgi:hypothetical protein
MISDDEYKGALARKNPYEAWLKKQEITMDQLPKSAPPVVPKELHMAMLRAFGYTTETLEMLLQPMAFDAMEGLGSMGNDVPLACISQRPRTIFDYFKQLFAQVRPMLLPAPCVNILPHGAVSPVSTRIHGTLACSEKDKT